MIVILKQNPNRDQLESLIAWLQEKGVTIHTSIGEAHTILGLVGDTSKLDIDLISALDIVEDVKRVQEPYKNANRKFHPEDTVIQVGNTQIGGGNLTIMAGPCSVMLLPLRYLPKRGPKQMAPTKASTPPTEWTMAEPAKSWNVAPNVLIMNDEGSALQSQPPPQVQ